MNPNRTAAPSAVLHSSRQQIDNQGYLRSEGLTTPLTMLCAALVSSLDYKHALHYALTLRLQAQKHPGTRVAQASEYGNGRKMAVVCLFAFHFIPSQFSKMVKKPQFNP